MTIQDLPDWHSQPVASVLDSAAYLAVLIFWARSAWRRDGVAVNVLVATPA